jgi:hypothetical protein
MHCNVAIVSWSSGRLETGFKTFERSLGDRVIKSKTESHSHLGEAIAQPRQRKTRDDLELVSERFMFRQVCDTRRKHLGARALSGRSATPCFERNLQAVENVLKA